MLSTHSRGAFIAAGFGVATIVLTRIRVASRVLLVGGVLAALLVFPGSLGTVDHSVVGDRTQTELADNDTARSQAAHLAIDLIPEHPLFGIGYGRFPAVAQNDSRVGINIDPHDQYLRLAVETGLPGFLLLCALVIPALRFGPRDRTKLGIQAIVVTYLIGMVFADSLSNLQITASFWLFLACCWVWRGEWLERQRADQTQAVTNGERLRPQALPSSVLSGPSAAPRRSILALGRSRSSV
jgi:O-antigen ligase